LNFFAHYYFDHELDRHPFNAGLIMPDLIRIFLPGRRFQPGKVHAAMLGETGAELFAGSLRHLERDQLFHRSPFFTGSESQLLALFRREKLELHIPRIWLAAHLVLELMLDRVLMKQNSAALDAFYYSLNQTHADDIEAFLKASLHNAYTDFHAGWNRFREMQYLYYYTDNDKFAYSIMRIYMRAGVSSHWTDEQLHILQTMLEPSEAIIFENLSLL
jgi:hypothetical protein